MACPIPHAVSGPEWLARNRAVARRIVQLIPGESDRDEEVLMAGPAAWGLRGRWHVWDADMPAGLRPQRRGVDGHRQGA